MVSRSVGEAIVLRHRTSGSVRNNKNYIIYFRYSENFNVKICISPQDDHPLPPLETIGGNDFGFQLGVRRTESQVPRTSYCVELIFYFLRSTVYEVLRSTYDVRRAMDDVVVCVESNHNMLC